MKILQRIFQTSLGRKYIMAITGLFLFLFVVGHLVGNLQFFLGREMINRYGHFLQSNPEIIWPARIGLVVIVALHLWSAIKLTHENRAARPVGYTNYQPVGSSYASRTMFMSGLIIAAFILFHLLHYTVRVQAVNLTGQDFRTFSDPAHGHDIFRMMVVGFSNLFVSGFYILSVGLLCLHLSHGISSFLQSLGFKNDAWRPVVDKAAPVIAGLIFLGYTSIPVAVLLGFGKEALK
jgi:succinate dehydrogenase / fumarate reductase cytochrome b subunit